MHPVKYLDMACIFDCLIMMSIASENCQKVFFGPQLRLCSIGGRFGSCYVN